MSQLRIFSYLPNPRIWKSTITARLCGVEIEVRGAPPSELRQWLWDFDARPINEVEPEVLASAARIGRIGFDGAQLFKTDAFLDAHPFGTVPAAFSADGAIGVFESNSIMRAVARLGAGACHLYGQDPYEASRIDSFLDVSLVFARDAQIYLLALRGDAVLGETYKRAADAFATYGAGLEQALRSGRGYLVGDRLSLADICFACELVGFLSERRQDEALARQGLTSVLAGAEARYPLMFAHLHRLAQHPSFAPDLAPYLARLESPA